ncbi:hypothetical protein JXA40_11210 [bacterium]|nr:hypothetical protein [candidate division CSSED10-310 bacterium]
MKKWKIIILNGGPIHIQEILDQLAERNFPVSKILLLGEAGRAGEIYEFRNEPLLVGQMEHVPEENYDAAVLLEPVEDLQGITSILVKGGIPLLDLSGSIRPGEQVPVLLGDFWELDSRSLPPVSIIPDALSLVTGLICKPVHEGFKIRQVTVNCVQGVSATGSRAAMDELLDQTRSLLGFKSIEINEFPKQIAFNTFGVGGISDIETRLNTQMQFLLNSDRIPFRIDMLWGCFFVGMAGTVWIDTVNPMSRDAVCDTVRSVPSFRLLPEGEWMSVLDTAGKDHVGIFDVRLAGDVPRSLTLRFAMDNLRKGLATNLVQTLELFT